MKGVERDLIRRRLRDQRLDRSEFRKPADVVQWLGAVQAQEYSGAVGLRAKGLTDAFLGRTAQLVAQQWLSSYIQPSG